MTVAKTKVRCQKTTGAPVIKILLLMLPPLDSGEWFLEFECSFCILDNCRMLRTRPFRSRRLHLGRKLDSAYVSTGCRAGRPARHSRFVVYDSRQSAAYKQWIPLPIILKIWKYGISMGLIPCLNRLTKLSARRRPSWDGSRKDR